MTVGKTAVTIQAELTTFFENVFGKEIEGAVRYAIRSKNDRRNFSSSFVPWPVGSKQLIEKIREAISQNWDVFYSPDLYSIDVIAAVRAGQKATKDHVLGSQWLFIDFDGDAPENLEWYQLHDIPKPSLVIQSSTVDRQHVYWKLTEFNRNIRDIEAARRGLIVRLGGDSSGWDVGQFLRVPFSVNHKYGKENVATNYDVTIELESNSIYSLDRFPISNPVEVVTSNFNKDQLPKVYEVLAKNKFSSDFLTEFFETVEERKARGGDRSGGYARITHLCTEDGLSVEETYVLLLDLDSRWGKYKGRGDQEKILLRTIAQIRAQPQHSKVVGEAQLIIKEDYTWGELMDSEHKIDWYFEELLAKNSYTILYGPPSVGKTTLALRFAACCATGESFAQWVNTIGRPMKTVVISLEMYIGGVKYFYERMSDLLEKRGLLNDHLLIKSPVGDLDIESRENRNILLTQLNEFEPEVVIIDSISHMAAASLLEDTTTRLINAFAKEIIAKIKCSVVAIHHPTKTDNLKGNYREMYGGMHFLQGPDSILALLPTEEENTIELHISKSRYNPRQGRSYGLRVTDNANYEITHLSAKEEADAKKDALNNIFRPYTSEGHTDAADSSGGRGDSAGPDEKSFRL